MPLKKTTTKNTLHEIACNETTRYVKLGGNYVSLNVHK